MSSRRRIRVAFSYALLTEFIQGRTLAVRSSFPLTAEIVMCFHDNEREGMAWLIAEDESFEEVQRGELIPEMQVTFETK